MSLFEDIVPPQPLAERLRPSSLSDVVGQDEALALLNAFIDRAEMPSVVFWGPPGSGKTTLSRLMASLLGWEGRSLNATSASVKDIRQVAVEARELWRNMENRTLLFIDEIHRLNKSQQDVLLPIVEAGTLILAGSTTENPFFSLNQALRSRVQLVQLKPLTPEQILFGLKRAIERESFKADHDALEWISLRVAGDLRMAYAALESAQILAAAREKEVGLDEVMLCLSRTQLAGDRKGDNHYDLASAFQKSLRGSDPNAAVYYLARFLECGEDPRFIARRLLVTASEDVGNADPMAFTMASNAFRAVEVLGMPEARIPLTQATIYVAKAPKSNEAVKAIATAVNFLKTRPLDPIPAHLRDAHYAGAKDLGHGEGYIYSHAQPNAPQTFLPDSIKKQVFLPEVGKKERLDESSLTWLVQFLSEEMAEKEWFELEAEPLAQKIKWPISKVRVALNNLVQDGKLVFKRNFKLKQHPGEADS